MIFLYMESTIGELFENVLLHLQGTLTILVAKGSARAAQDLITTPTPVWSVFTWESLMETELWALHKG